MSGFDDFPDWKLGGHAYVCGRRMKLVGIETENDTVVYKFQDAETQFNEITRELFFAGEKDDSEADVE